MNFLDPRDGKVYKTVQIGEQVWLAENLNYECEGSVCYGNNPANGEKYGRLYDLETAKKVCPPGWHLPNLEEWDILADFAGGDGIAEIKLRTKNGWEWNDHENISGNGTDDYGFSALPGGCGDSGGNFYRAGRYGYWWYAGKNEDGSTLHYRIMYCNIADASPIMQIQPDLNYLFSVRCVKDYQKNAAQSHFQSGEAYYQKSDYDAAIVDFTKAIELSDKPNAFYYHWRGAAYCKKDNYYAAVADFTKAIELKNKLTDYFWRGTAYYDEGDYDAAIADFTKAIELRGKTAYYYLWRGVAYYRKYDFDVAIADFTKAIELDDKPNANYYHWRGVAYYDIGDYDVAIVDLTKVIELRDKQNAEDYLFRGLAYYDKGDYDTAIADLTKTIELRDKPSAIDYNDRGWVYCQKCDYDAAIADFTKAIELSDISKYYHNRGRAYYLKRNNDAAIVDFTEAIELSDYVDADDYYWRGRAYESKGDNDAACRDYEKTLEIDPEFTGVKDQLAILKKTRRA